MSFAQAFQHTLASERGYSDNPKDPGGKTIWGITEKVARNNGYLGPMRDMPIETAETIYQTEVWNALGLGEIDKISPRIAAEMFDTAVNCGNSIPGQFLQLALNALNREGMSYPDLLVDGHAGPVTRSALRAYLAERGAEGENVMLACLNGQQLKRYMELVLANPHLETFFYGWVSKRVLN